MILQDDIMIIMHELQYNIIYYFKYYYFFFNNIIYNNISLFYNIYIYINIVLLLELARASQSQLELARESTYVRPQSTRVVIVRRSTLYRDRAGWRRQEDSRRVARVESCDSFPVVYRVVQIHVREFSTHHLLVLLLSRVLFRRSLLKILQNRTHIYNQLINIYLIIYIIKKINNN